MAQNLVPLFIDKFTGILVASKNNNGNGNGNNTGFEHIQNVPIFTWNIQHNFNNKKLICQIYDNNDRMIIPDEIQIVDDNTVQVTFTFQQAGSAKIVFF